MSDGTDPTTGFWPRDGFWYASVGGNPTEIVRISDRKMYSPGCADAHELKGVELILWIDPGGFPLNQAAREKQERAWERERQAYKHRTGHYPGYRTFP